MAQSRCWDYLSNALPTLIRRSDEEGTAAMDAGWVYHLLAQARHLEEIQPVREYPNSPIRPLCWIWHHLAGIAREPWTMEQLKSA